MHYTTISGLIEIEGIVAWFSEDTEFKIGCLISSVLNLSLNLKRCSAVI